MGKVITKDKSFYKTLIALAIPISLQNLISFATGLADNVQVGSLGDFVVSGVYMGSQVQTMLQIVVDGILMAMLILSSQYWGKGDTGTIKKIVSLVTRILGALGIVVCLATFFFPAQVLSLFTSEKPVIAQGVIYLRIVSVSYIFYCVSQLLIVAMRTIELARIGMYCSIVSMAANISLNYVMINGKLGFSAMGIRGAAIATVIARFLEAAVIIVYVFFIDKRLCFKLKDSFIFDKKIRHDYIKYGLPLISGAIVWAANSYVNSGILGHCSTEVITASSMANQLNNLIYIWVMGVAAAVGIITGKTVGAGKFDTMKLYAKTVQFMFLGIGIVCSLLVLLIKGPVIAMYDVSPEAKQIAEQFMDILAITVIATCYQASCLSGLVKAGGDTSFVFKDDTVFVFLVILPLSLLALHFGAAPWVVFLCLKIDQLCKCVVAYLKINSFNWMKKLTTN